MPYCTCCQQAPILGNINSNTVACNWPEHTLGQSNMLWMGAITFNDFFMNILPSQQKFRSRPWRVQKPCRRRDVFDATLGFNTNQKTHRCRRPATLQAGSVLRTAPKTRKKPGSCLLYVQYNICTAADKWLLRILTISNYRAPLKIVIFS